MPNPARRAPPPNATKPRPNIINAPPTLVIAFVVSANCLRASTIVGNRSNNASNNVIAVSLNANIIAVNPDNTRPNANIKGEANPNAAPRDTATNPIAAANANNPGDAINNATPKPAIADPNATKFPAFLDIIAPASAKDCTKGTTAAVTVDSELAKPINPNTNNAIAAVKTVKDTDIITTNGLNIANMPSNPAKAASDCILRLLIACTKVLNPSADAESNLIAAAAPSNAMVKGTNDNDTSKAPAPRTIIPSPNTANTPPTAAILPHISNKAAIPSANLSKGELANCLIANENDNNAKDIPSNTPIANAIY